MMGVVMALVDFLIILWMFWPLVETEEEEKGWKGEKV